MSDYSKEIQQRVLDAYQAETPLNIIGGDSKSWYGCEAVGEALHVGEHAGILNYQPTELIITARAGRKAAFPAVGRLAPDYYCMDGTIPKAAFTAVLRQIAQWSDEYGLPVANVFHAGDGNMHPLILYDANKSGELEKTEEFGAKNSGHVR